MKGSEYHVICDCGQAIVSAQADAVCRRCGLAVRLEWPATLPSGQPKLCRFPPARKGDAEVGQSDQLPLETALSAWMKLFLRGDQPMEVVAAITAFFTWAATPSGQNVTEDIRAVDRTFAAKVSDMFNHLHSKVPHLALAPAAPSPDPAGVQK